MNREELFKKANEAYKQEKKQKEEKKGGMAFIPAEYTALNANEFKQLRLLGNPFHMRLDDPFSVKKVNVSMILGDDGTSFRCVWPDLIDHQDWILWRVYNKVMSYTYDRNLNVRKYNHQQSHPTIFNRVFKNNRTENTLETGWRPINHIVMNVIDRSQYKLHQEKKKTFLLSKKGSETGWFEPGIPPMLYEMIYDGIVQFNGDFQNYDVIIKKITMDPWYYAYHPVDDKKKFINDFAEFQPKFAEQPLTTEELSWERENIDKIFKITSYSKIYKKLKLFIVQVDNEFKTSYLSELEGLLEKEVKEQKENAANNVSSQLVDEDDSFEELEVKSNNKVDDITENLTIPEDKIPEQKVESVQNVRPRSKPTVNNFDINIFMDASFKGLNKLPAKFKDMIIGQDSEGNFIYNDQGGTIYNCVNAECRFPAPESFPLCPKCGTEF